jgi:hypothetical protein
MGLDWPEKFEEAFSAYPFSVSRRDSYRDELTGQQVRMLDDILGEDLIKYGYATEGGGPRAPESDGVSE